MTWMNAEYETSHALAYKEHICEHEPERGEKNVRVFRYKRSEATS